MLCRLLNSGHIGLEVSLWERSENQSLQQARMGWQTQIRLATIARTWVMTWKIAYICKNMGHFGTSWSVWGRVKLKAPYSQGQGKGAAVDPMISPIPASHYEDMIWMLSSHAVSLTWSTKLCKGQSHSVQLYLWIYWVKRYHHCLTQGPWWH